MSELRFTILGCGSSGGVPRLGNLWGDHFSFKKFCLFSGIIHSIPHS